MSKVVYVRETQAINFEKNTLKALRLKLIGIFKGKLARNKVKQQMHSWAEAMFKDVFHLLRYRALKNKARFRKRQTHLILETKASRIIIFNQALNFFLAA